MLSLMTEIIFNIWAKTQTEFNHCRFVIFFMISPRILCVVFLHLICSMRLVSVFLIGLPALDSMFDSYGIMTEGIGMWKVGSGINSWGGA